MGGLATVRGQLLHLYDVRRFGAIHSVGVLLCCFVIHFVMLIAISRRCFKRWLPFCKRKTSQFDFRQVKLCQLTFLNGI